MRHDISILELLLQLSQTGGIRKRSVTKSSQQTLVDQRLSKLA
jgi:hypothetical protein